MNAAPPSEVVVPTARVLVTGLKGFTGRYLAETLTHRGCAVHGTMAGNESHTPRGEREHVADLLDPQALRAVIEEVRPTHVVHLAAISFVAHGDAEALYRTNVVGTRNLLQAIATAGHADLRSVLLASSANARLLDIPAAEPINVCSGESHSLSEILSLASEITGHSPRIRVNPAFVRATEVKHLRGSNERLRSLIGTWRARPVRETLEWMLAA